ncbi:uncharacterized protein BJ171DRAFT_501760 [Polychytrium aggregatum]|uniref:uncharacterized protein n=1 Tax=Polychytrium aggregatum TaxID=110093 RepID=UPI0022FEDDB7|nr:uncharacterized protein BJ171DRAFT_501760 [Polychytrium aggregatum]KAI9205316.1 hypothetical protein BJ171DRAFT_501760 [Polychytrium aggregatum]
MSNLHPSEEGFFRRTKRKFLENPFIFPGFVACTYGLFLMIRSLNRGDKIGFQYGQRFRVGAHVLTVAFFAGGMLYHDWNKKQKQIQESGAAAQA